MNILFIKFLKVSQLSYINLNAPAKGLTKNNNKPCQLFLTKSITVLNACGIVTVKKLTNHSPTTLQIFFITSHKLIQNSLNASHLFHKIANVATKVTIPATIQVIGLARNAKLRPF